MLHLDRSAQLCAGTFDDLFEQEHSMRRVIVTTALVLFAGSAFAFDTSKLGQVGSLPLDDMKGLIAKSPKLKGEVDEAVAKIAKKPDEIMCNGMRFPGAWKELGGVRVSPYSCQLGDKWLQVRAKVQVTGKRGKLYARVDKEAMRRAENVLETDPTWTWSDKEPSEP
jgi:hypothetical protein